MLNTVYRAIIIGRAESAKNYFARNLSERELNGFGPINSSFISTSVQNVIEDLNEAEKPGNKSAIGKPASKGLWTLYSFFNEKNVA